jgi:hypothetical protein
MATGADADPKCDGGFQIERFGDVPTQLAIAVAFGVAMSSARQRIEQHAAMTADSRFSQSIRSKPSTTRSLRPTLSTSSGRQVSSGAHPRTRREAALRS